MEKLLLSLLLICSLTQAQNKSIISKMSETKSLEDTKTISDEIVKGFEIEMKYYTTVQSGKTPNQLYQLVVYIPTSITPLGKKLTDEEREKALIINFGEYNKGENIDLGVKGETVYYFRNVSGSYLDLIDFWIATFYPDSTKEEVLENYRLQEYRVNKDLKFKLKKNAGVWELSKSY